MSRTVLESVLYVEDDPDIRAVAEIALETIGGFVLCSCSSGQQALAKVQHFQPDLLLLDVMMPDLGGPATLLELRKLAHCASTPVIFMTAKLQSQDMHFYQSLGAIGVVPKPFDPILLASLVRELWEKYHTRQTLG